MLTLWIPAEKGVENTLPGYTTHTVGVGAVVVNAKNEILVVQERSGPARCAFSDRNLHSRMPLVPTHVRLKLLHACGQSRPMTFLSRVHSSYRLTL
jgi:hypothetical protein